MSTENDIEKSVKTMNLIITNLIGKVTKLEKNSENYIKKQEELEKTILNLNANPMQSNLQLKEGEKKTDNDIPNEEFSKYLKDYISKNESELVNLIGSKINENYGKKTENLINLTTTIKQLNEDRIKQVETKFNDSLNIYDKNISDLSNKCSHFENVIKNIEDNRNSFQQNITTIENSLENTIKLIENEKAFLRNLVDQRIEQLNSEIFKRFENFNNNIVLKDSLDTIIQETNEKMNSLELKLKSESDSLINNIQKDLSDKFYHEIQISSEKLEETNNKNLNDFKKDISVNLANFKDDYLTSFQNEINDKINKFSEKIFKIETSLGELRNNIKEIDDKTNSSIDEKERNTKRFLESILLTENKISNIEKIINEREIYFTKEKNELEISILEKYLKDKTDLVEILEKKIANNTEEIKSLIKESISNHLQSETKIENYKEFLSNLIEKEVSIINRMINEEKENILNIFNQRLESYHNQTNDNINNNVNKQEAEMLFDQKLESHKKEVLNHIEQELFIKSLTEIEKFKKEHESKLIVINEIQDKFSQMIQNFNSSFVEINNLIEVKEEKLFKTFEENKESMMRKIENQIMNIELLSQTDISLRNEIEQINMKMLNISKSEEIINGTKIEMLRINEIVNKNNAENLIKLNELNEKINSLSSEMNTRLELSLDNINEKTLLINKQIETLIKDVIDNSTGNSNDLKDIREKLEEIKKESNANLIKEKEDFEIKFTNLNKMINNLQSNLNLSEESSKQISISLQMKLSSIELNIEKLATLEYVHDIINQVNNISKNISSLDQIINSLKENVKQNSEIINSDKADLLRKIDKINEDFKNSLENDISTKINKIGDILTNNELIFNSNLENMKLENTNEILKIREEYKNNDSRLELAVNDSKTYFSINISQIQSSLNELNNYIQKNENKIEIIPSLEEKLTILLSSHEKSEKSFKESILTLENDQKKIEEKVINILNHTTVINNNFDDLVVKHDIFENQSAILTKNVQELINNANLYKENSLENKVNLEVLQEKIKSTECLLTDKLETLEALIKEEKQSMEKILGNYLLKEESSKSLNNINKELNEIIRSCNNSFDEKLNININKINDFQNLFEGKLTENRKSLNKMSESIILESNRLSHRLSEVEKFETAISCEVKDLDKKITNIEENVGNLVKSDQLNITNIKEISQNIEIIKSDLNSKLESFNLSLEKQIKELDDKNINLETNMKSLEETFDKRQKGNEILNEELLKTVKSLSSDLDNYNKNSTVLESNTRNYIQKEITNLNSKLKEIKADLENKINETKEKFDNKTEDIYSKITTFNNELEAKCLNDLETLKELEEQLKLIDARTIESENAINLINIRINQSELNIKSQNDKIDSTKVCIEEGKIELEEKLKRQSLVLNDLLLKNKEVEEENNEFESHFLEEFKDLKRNNTPSTSLNIPNESTFSFSDDEDYAISLKNHLLLRNKYNKCESISKSTQIKSLLLKIESYSLLRFKYLFSKVKKYITSQERLEMIIINNINNKFSNFEETKQKIDINFSCFNNKVDNLSNKIHNMNEYLVLKKGKSEAQEMNKLLTEINTVNSNTKDLKKSLDKHDELIKNLQASQKNNEILEILKNEVNNFDSNSSIIIEKIQSLWDTISLITNDN